MAAVFKLFVTTRKTSCILASEISLTIFNRKEIAAGKIRYQIARQPDFPPAQKILNDRRGDIPLLINGMPVIHIELKRSGVPVSQACNQIEKYSTEGCFSGLFHWCRFCRHDPGRGFLYFANPGPEGKIQSRLLFSLGWFCHEPIKCLGQFHRDLLSIPWRISLSVFTRLRDGSRRRVESDAQLPVSGGQRHFRQSGQVSLGSGKSGRKTSAAVLSGIQRVPARPWLHSSPLNWSPPPMMRTRLSFWWIESNWERKAWRNTGVRWENEAVQATENTSVLVGKLKSGQPVGYAGLLRPSRKWAISGTRATTAWMPPIWQGYNPDALFSLWMNATAPRSAICCEPSRRRFPGHVLWVYRDADSRRKSEKQSTTSTIFGDELHRYSIADGIRDKNVLGFDPYKVTTYKRSGCSEYNCSWKARALDVEEVYSDPRKERIFYHYMNLPMAGKLDPNCKYKKGIEDYIPVEQYQNQEHQNKVVEDILENWSILSHKEKFHAIFATSSIPEAIEYYRRFKKKSSKLKITALFDPSIDNDNAANALDKEAGLKEIIEDYRFSGHRKKIWIRARHTNESKVWAQRQNRIAIPRQSFSCPNIFSIILRFCTAQSRIWRAKFCYISVGYMFFVPYVEQFCRILSVSYALSASRYFIRNWSRLIISYPSLASFTCPPVRQKSSGIFFYICDHVYFSS